MSPRSKENSSLWRQNLARSHLFRKEHTNLLAEPNWRRVKNDVVSSQPLHISHATLTAAPTERTGMLSVPKQRPSLPENPVPRKIRPATLHARPRERVKLLAISKLPNLVIQKHMYKELLGEGFVERMDKYIKEKEDNMWKPPPHSWYLGISESKLKKFESETEWNNYLEKLEKIARPKRDLSQQRPPKRKKVPLATLQARINEMCQPPDRLLKRDPPPPPLVRKAALEYTPTERVKELCIPKKHYIPDPGPPKTETGVTISALNYKAPPRYDVLATPRDRRHQTEQDVRENAFAINPLALKYVITPRMAKLALPKGAES